MNNISAKRHSLEFIFLVKFTFRVSHQFLLVANAIEKEIAKRKLANYC